MAKYHVNQNTQKPNLCRATKRPCPLGADTPHFESKEEAQAYVEAEAKKDNFTFSTLRKPPATTPNSAAAERRRKALEEFHSLRESKSIYEMVSQLPNASILEEHSHVDYNNQVVVEREGDHYLLDTHEGTWSDFYYLSSTPVERATQKQIAAGISSPVDSTEGYDEVNATLGELLDDYKNKRGDSLLWEEDGAMSLDASLVAGSPYGWSSSLGGKTREDGSKIIIEALTPPADGDVLDKPLAVQVDLDLYENGQLQNARQMEQGVLVYDTRHNSGVVLCWMDGSESVLNDNENFLWRDGALVADPKLYQSIRILEGDGSERDASYWKLLP